MKSITSSIVRVPVDEVPQGGSRSWLLKRFLQMPWYQVYDMLEFVAENASHLSRGSTTEAFQQHVNSVLEEENAGYRFIRGQLTEITSPAEIREVEQALENTSRVGLDTVREHIEQALQLLGKRPAPDVRNAIKEAISAVESATKLIGEERNGTLDDALESLARRMPIHPAMKQGFTKLYGFTSDSSGIRHALIDEPTVTSADARFMIIACSAFVNWLITKASDTGMLGSHE